MTKALLRVPPNWPLLWNGMTNVRGACPCCGTMHLYIDRPEDETPTVECRECGVSGVAVVQRAFDKLMKPAKPTLKPEAVPQESISA